MGLTGRELGPERERRWWIHALVPAVPPDLEDRTGSEQQQATETMAV